MIEKIIEYSVRNPLIIILLTLAVVAWGGYCVMRTPIDAIPDLSENQVIVFTDWMGRSPQEIEDQITYPLSVNLQGLAGVKAVRSTSEFNFSMINIIFEDKIDFYFARTRVLERLSIASTLLPSGVTPYLAYDATALGQIFWYTVEGEGYDLGELRAIQDWYVRYQLNSVPGVSQVSSVGGFVREYQIDVDPNKLRAYEIPLGAVFQAVTRSNSSVGGKVFIKNNAEYLIRGFGWIRDVKDIENIVVAERKGVPIYAKNIASVQVGPEFRRSVLEKNGSETVGGVCMMRYGENPLEVTKRIKQKVQQLQPGLPPGVRIVPFYDRTRLIHEAIETVTGTLKEEMIVASVAVLLILYHLRSSIVICVTLPLAALISFILMYYLKIPSNIMSLSGIAISIGVLVDAGIVMTENAFHTLNLKFGKEKVRGDTREIVLPACKLVGRPLFFSVMIMVLSFLPVFALGGMEGRMFHPLAFTKTFALVGVSILAITLCPAIIPFLLKGRLRAPEENWIMRGFINIYMPMLTFLMRYPKTCIWFIVLFVAIGGRYAGKLGREFMPPLDEDSVLDMPVTVPRASVTQAGDDLKERDAIMRLFPEVESVVGKAGRADTPTDPSPLDMVETIVTLRPKDLWPKREMEFNDALKQAKVTLKALQAKGIVKPTPKPDEADALVNQATMDAVVKFDATMRELARRRQAEFMPELGEKLVRGTLDDLVAFLQEKGELKVAQASRLRSSATETVAPPEATGTVALLSEKLASVYGQSLADQPLLEDLTRMVNEAVEGLARAGLVGRKPDLLLVEERGLEKIVEPVKAVLGEGKKTLFQRLLDQLEERRHTLWKERVKILDWELFDRAPASLLWPLLEALRDGARSADLLAREPSEEELRELRGALEPDFAKTLFLWRKLKTDIVKEMDSELQFPGWGNIWTQPIINRVDMLATGVRTMIGVKVFGDDLNEIQEVSNEIADALRPIRGAVDVFPDQTVGENYLEVNIDREKAARYGINVGDIQDVVEVAMGGKMITLTVEGRRRFPVRVRYGRDFREDEEAIKRILVSGQGIGMTAASEGGGEMGMGSAPSAMNAGGSPIQVPLSEVAEVKIVEGPTMIRSENGLLRAYVQLNVRDRDIVGFVEEAQRVVAEKVKLPSGMFIEWSGQFEHQVRAKKTLQVIFPMVILLIFVILYVTYHNLIDTLIMFLAVPGALTGGVLFQYLFGFNFSVAVWVGYIACFGLATETAIVMVIYLREAIDKRGGLENIKSEAEITEAVIEGAVHRLRPKLLTEGTTIVGLVPMLWASGTGAEIMRPMAAPVLGGILVADEVIDLFIPVIFHWHRVHVWRKLQRKKALAAGEPKEAQHV